MLRSNFSQDGLRLRGATRLHSVLPRDTGRNAYARAQSLRRQAATQAQGDNEQNVEEAEAAVLKELEIIDLTEEDLSQQTQADSQGRYRYKRITRNATLQSSHRQRSVYKFGDIELKPGTCVELRESREPDRKWKIQFVEIKSIWTSRTDGTVTIRGLPYVRTCSLGGMLEKKMNEVCQILQIDNDDKRPDEVQGLFEINPQQILRVRTLYKTNALFEKYGKYQYGGQNWSHKTKEERKVQAPLTCRWKFRMGYQNSHRRSTEKPNDFALLAIRQAEASPQLRDSDKEIKLKWRGGITVRGGSHIPEVGEPGAGTGQQYTFADICCGGGGTSHGAVMAGFKLRFGVDHWPQACASWRRNFPDARMYEQDITDFIRKTEIDYVSCPIDVLHLSPPCQPWCRYAYIHGERENDPNKDLLLSCSDIIDKCRNRIVTLEQTFSILDPSHEMYFNTLVQGFTRRGFSVRWSVIPLIQYGLPQDRKRLLMIGACPGEQLPPWPPATHSATPRQGQKPFVTEAEALRGLNSRRVSLHDVARAAVRNGSRRDANLPFPKTITCGGTQGILHPSGTRDFTVREIASLQGFPIYHEFEGNKTAIKKQIGNAFPSCVVKNIYDHLRKWLEEVDGVQRAAPAQARLPAPPVPRPVVDRRRRENPPHALPLEPQHLVNGDLHEDEALQLALQESMHGHHPSASGAIIEISDDEGKQQDSPVSAVAPLLKRMSIALSNHRAEFDSQSRSRSVTLDFSPSPSPGPSRHAKAASQKRSLDLMHDGEADEVMKEASPPKRERVLEAGNHAEGTIDKIPSALPRYAGPQNAHDSANEVVFVDQSKRDSQNGVRKSNSTPEEHDSHRATIAGETAPRKSSYTIDWSSILSQAKMAGNFGNEVWTF